MSSLRNVLSDLVEKRLWPVAVLLLGALVAVPLLLAKSPAAQPGTTPIAASAAAAADAPHTEPAVRLTAKPALRAPLRGRVKDPFRQQYVPPKADTADGGGTPPVAEPGTPSTEPSTPPEGSGSPGGAPAQPKKTYEVVAVDVRFGKATGPQHTHEDVPRLTPLPNAVRPIVVFLGMRKDLETAVFLISSDVHAQGDGTCTPSVNECTAIEVREGDVVLLDVTGTDGRVTQYELDLVKVTTSQTTSKADAQAAYARVSHVGARLLARRVRVSARNTAVGGRSDRIPYRYAVARGVLHIAPFLSRRLAGQAHASSSAGPTRAVPAPDRAVAP